MQRRIIFCPILIQTLKSQAATKFDPEGDHLREATVVHRLRSERVIGPSVHGPIWRAGVCVKLFVNYMVHREAYA